MPSISDSDWVVRRAVDKDVASCLEIVAGLADFFTADVPEHVRHDMAGHRSWVITQGDAVVGFAVIARRGPLAAEILWAAVAGDRRGEHLGTRLVDQILDELRTDGVKVVEVKTLDSSAGYEPYTATRAFWVARGFVQLDTIDPLPGWQPGNPAAILVAALSATR